MKWFYRFLSDSAESRPKRFAIIKAFSSSIASAYSSDHSFDKREQVPPSNNFGLWLLTLTQAMEVKRTALIIFTAKPRTNRLTDHQTTLHLLSIFSCLPSQWEVLIRKGFARCAALLWPPINFVAYYYFDCRLNFQPNIVEWLIDAQVNACVQGIKCMKQDRLVQSKQCFDQITPHVPSHPITRSRIACWW